MSRTQWIAFGATFGAVLTALFVACALQSPSRPPVSDLLPTLAEIYFIECDLNGADFGRPNRHACRVPREAYDFLLRFLTPSGTNDSTDQFLDKFPPLGVLRIHRKDGHTHRVVFVEGGMNPLAFSYDGLAYYRGGRNYPDYAKDHREYVGIDAEHIDESMGLAENLDNLCTSTPN